MRTRVKICCISSMDEAALAVRMGADALGLVAAMPSGPGVIAEDLIAEIAAATPPPVATFLLSSSERAEEIAAQVERCWVNCVQIVTHIEPAESARLAQLLPAIRRIQVIHVEDDSAPELIARYAPHVHAFLLDSGRPSLAVPELGGTGRIHDWRVSAAFVARSSRPVFLAGGLGPENVGEAIVQVRPYGVDICSGVRRDGKLHGDSLQRYIAAVRHADGGLRH